MSTTSTTSAANYFNGESTFSAQLNNVITQAVAEATAPITQLQNEQSTLTGQQSEIQTLGSDFMSIQSAIDTLNSASGANSYSASVSSSSVATALTSSGVLPGTYSLNVTSIGSQTNAISETGTSVTDPTSQNISSATTFNLTVGTTSYSISPSGTSLNSLVQAINASGAAVQATVVNVGGSASPDYRLSVQGTQYSSDAIGLTAGSTNLLTTLSTGTPVTYQVNGQPSAGISSNSRTLSLSTGLTANVLATGSTNITVAPDTSDISNALSTFVSAYNSALAEVTKNRGQNGGALTGDALIGNLQQALNTLGSYSSGSTSGVSSLSDLGIAFDENGELAFDQTTFDTTAASNPSELTSFLGSETTSGFIQSAYNTLTGLTDPTSGSITVAGNNIGTTVTNLTTEITSKQAQVTQLQTNLTSQMAQADSAITSLQGQLTEITDLFTAETQAQKDITG